MDVSVDPQANENTFLWWIELYIIKALYNERTKKKLIGNTIILCYMNKYILVLRWYKFASYIQINICNIDNGP